jgi:hypothetical protein
MSEQTALATLLAHSLAAHFEPEARRKPNQMKQPSDFVERASYSLLWHEGWKHHFSACTSDGEDWAPPDEGETKSYPRHFRIRFGASVLPTVYSLRDECYAALHAKNVIVSPPAPLTWVTGWGKHEEGVAAIVEHLGCLHVEATAAAFAASFGKSK